MVCNDRVKHEALTCNCVSKIEAKVWRFTKTFKDLKALRNFLIHLWVDVAGIYVIVGALFFKRDLIGLIGTAILIVLVGVSLPLGIAWLRRKK